MGRLLGLVVLAFMFCALAARGVRAEPCPPAVALTGDETLVTAVRDLLGPRGIAKDTPRCPGVRARIERRGGLVVVGTQGPDGTPIERAVRETATAATVIESWTRSDVAAPLLAMRELPAVDEVARAPAAPAARGIQLAVGLETSVGSDRTVWQGLELGVCVMLGPICAAGRVHAGKVIAQPGSWDGFERKGGDVYAGIDVPIAIGGVRLTPGFAAGFGEMFTHHKSEGDRMGVEISGPRAELHTTLSLPLTPHVALDLMLGCALTQATATELKGIDAPDPALHFPAEPRAFARFAVGVRYGAR